MFKLTTAKNQGHNRIVSILNIISSIYFTPLSGQLEAAFKLNPAGAPPLSVEKMIILSFSMSFLDNASTSSPIASSIFVKIAVNLNN